MRQEYVIRLFEQLEEPIYEQVLEFLKEEKFTIKGFRDIRKLAKNQIARGLYRRQDVLTRTLLYIQDLYQLRECIDDADKKEMDNGKLPDIDFEDLIERFPEKKNGFLANCLLTTPKYLENLLNVNKDKINLELTDEDIEYLKGAEDEGYDIFKEYMESLLPDEAIIEKEKTLLEDKVVNTKEDTDKNNMWREKYEEEKNKNKELSKKNKSQKLELYMLEENIQKKDKLLKEKEEKQNKLLKTIDEWKIKWEEEHKNKLDIEEQMKEMKEIFQRVRILYIGMPRNLEMFSKEFQIDVLKEEDVILDHLQLKQYEEIWLVDNEIASLYNKRYINKMASQLGITIYSFYGETQLLAYIRRKKMQKIIEHR